MRAFIIGGTASLDLMWPRGLHNGGRDVKLFHCGEHESDLLPPVQHFRSPQAAMPVLSFPEDLLRIPFEIVIHMIPMGEADARAAVQTFACRTQHLVLLSSGDVYRAYGRFTSMEPGTIEKDLLTEDSPLRNTLYPYRSSAKSSDELNYYYEKILVEREVLGRRSSPQRFFVCRRYTGGVGNANPATIYGFRDQPEWRWTHGYLENVAAAIVLAALHPAAANRMYNVGEAFTPTMGERLKHLPPSTLLSVDPKGYDFRHDIAYDTTRIRKELSYTETVSYEEGLKRTLTG